MTYGGLPQVVGLQSERQKADYLKNIFANVYLKDVIERNKIQNVDEIGILSGGRLLFQGMPPQQENLEQFFTETVLQGGMKR